MIIGDDRNMKKQFTKDMMLRICSGHICVGRQDMQLVRQPYLADYWIVLLLCI